MTRRNKTPYPMRKCVGCNISKKKEELFRISCHNDEIKVDIDGKAMGRGVYLCKNEQCLDRAVKRKSFYRAYGKQLPEKEENWLREKIRKEKIKRSKCMRSCHIVSTASYFYCNIHCSN